MDTTPVTYHNGKAEWTHQAGDQYIVTGTRPNGRRFRCITATWMQAHGINVWQGSKWLQRNGKRYRLQTITN